MIYHNLRSPLLTYSPRLQLHSRDFQVRILVFATVLPLPLARCIGPLLLMMRTIFFQHLTPLTYQRMVTDFFD